MNDKYRLIYSAHEILETQLGATAMPTTGQLVQSSRSGGRDFHDWAIDMSVVGDLAGGWRTLVDAYLSDDKFNTYQRVLARTFWRLVRKRRGLYSQGLQIAELLGVD